MKAQRLPDDGKPLNCEVNRHLATVRKSTAIERASWDPVTRIIEMQSGRKMPVTTYAMKPCLRCKVEFESQGHHNRLCHNCTALVAKRQDAGVFAEGAGTHHGGNKHRRGHS